MGRPEKLVRDRTGILLILAGAALIFWNVCGSSGGAAANGQETRTEGAVYSRESVAGQAQEDTRKPAGCLQLAGSSSMEKYAGALAERFMETYPDAAVTLQFTGSSAGIAAVTGGSADIGMSSRYLKKEEKGAGATENIVGFDGIAICANPANGISGLTGEQLSQLYTGKIRSWSELGGSDLPVVLIGREAGSGTRNAFEEWLGLAGRCTYANELDSTGAVMARIAVTPGAVGYASLEAADRMNSQTEAEGGAETALTVLALDGAEPSMANIRNGSYPLYRPFIMVTKGEAENGNELVRAWFTYVGSEEGERIAESMKIITNPQR